jgi:hypothetical protein
MKFIFLKTCKCKIFKEIYQVIQQDLEYPLRIKAAATVSFGLCFVANLTVMAT